MKYVIYDNQVKTELFSSSKKQDLIDDINKFIEDKIIIDIKFQSIYIETIRTINDRVLIIYKERN